MERKLYKYPVESKYTQDKEQAALERANELLSGLYSDLTLEVAGPDGEVGTIQAHRYQLTMVSSVWASAIKWATDGKLTVTEFSYKTIKNMIYYIYTKRIEFENLDECIEIMKAADFYDIDGLIEKCNSFIEECIKKQNLSLHQIVYIFNKATLHNMEFIKVSCISYIEDNTRQVLESEEFLDFTLESVKTILEMDNYLCPENYLIRATIRWAENVCKNETNIGEFMRSRGIIKLFRFIMLSKDDLQSLTMDFPWLFTGEDPSELALQDNISQGAVQSLCDVSRGGENSDYSMKLFISYPPVGVIEEFTYVGPNVLFPIVSVRLESRVSSLNMNITNRYEERFSIKIGDHTVDFDGCVDSRLGAVVYFPQPVNLQLTSNTKFNIQIILRKSGMYYKNSNFSLYQPGLVRLKSGIIKDINGFLEKASTSHNPPYI